MKKGKNGFKLWLSALLCVALLCTAAMGLAACGDASDLRIDVPARIEEDIGTGTYVVPRYEVVNPKGMVMAGYKVSLKSVKNPDGEDADIAHEASTIVSIPVAGEYTFVYTTGTKDVPDATVIMDFADRKAPTINLAASSFPAFFIKGNTYAIPEYTLNGDFKASACFSKVFYTDGESEEVEVTCTDGEFEVDKDSGKYKILIHVEDAAGNYNEYPYVRSVYSPAEYDPSIVVYFNEAFGDRQVSADGDYMGKYVSKEDGGKAYGDELGSYKVEFDGNTTNNNEAYFAINVPAISNIMGYKELEMYVYVDDTDCPHEKDKWIVGSKWWNDTEIETGKWQRVTWSVDNWGNGKGQNSGATTNNIIGIDNISGTRIRLIPDQDYGKSTPPHGTVYFSAMRLVPHTWVNITCENGVGAPARVKLGETVKLTAPEASDGEYFDCFLVDGKPISGNSFTPREEADVTVSVKWSDTPISKDNFTWGEFEYLKPEGKDSQKTQIAVADKWVLEYDVYGMNNNADGSATWCFTGAYIGGVHQLLGFELDNKNDKLSGYGGSWKQMDGVKLTKEQSKILRDATQDSPAKLTYVRDGDKVVVLLDHKFVGVFSFAAFEISGDDFGLGGRKDPTNGIMKNIRYVVGEDRIGLAQSKLGMEVTVTVSAGAHANVEKAYKGDTITLTHDEAEEGMMFAYYTVDDKKIDGDTFVATADSHDVKAVYSEISTLTLGAGITANGESGETVKVAKGAAVTLKFVGKSPAGKYFTGFKVGNTAIEGNTFTPTESAHTVAAVFADRVENGNAALNAVSTVQSNGDWRSKGNNTPTSVEYVTDVAYDGIDATVSVAGSLKVTVSGGDNGISLNGKFNTNLNDYKEMYFYAYTEAEGVQAGAWWCADTTLTAGKWTKVTITRSMNVAGLNNEKVWETEIENFVYRFIKAAAGTVFYVTDIYGVPYADVTVTKADANKDLFSISAPANGTTYKESETVTLTAGTAPEGKAFSHFTANGTKFDGNTYTLGTEAVEFNAIFGDKSTLTLGEGVNTTGNKTEYAQGTKIRFTFDASKLNGKVVDYYLVDKGTASEVRVYNGEFVAAAATHTVEAVLVDPDAITWGEGGNKYNYETVMGSDASEWKARGLDGEVYGSAEYWAVSVNVKHTSGWESFEFIQGSKQSIRVRYHGDGFGGVVLMNDKKEETTPTNDFTVAYPTKNSKVVNKLVAGTTVTCVRKGNNVSMYLDGDLFFSTDYAVDHTGDWFGVGFVSGNDANVKPAMTDTKFITGKEKVEAYLATIADKAPSANQINRIHSVTKAGDGCEVQSEYITEAIPEGLDAAIAKDGVCKVTPAGKDIGLIAEWTYHANPAKYSEIYFWVYIESEQTETLNHVAGGAYWKDGGNIESTNTWTKITLDSALIAQLTCKEDLGTFVFRVYSQTWQAGYTDITGKTVYISSLYGVPKA